jgi:hypothetical protein
MAISSSDMARPSYTERATLPPIGTLAFVTLVSLGLWGAIGYTVEAVLSCL